MTRHARRMLGHSEHRLVLMTARARLRLLGREPVRLVTARALRMSGGDRGERDLGRRPLLGVAGHARGVRDERRFMHRVAVEAAASPCMLRRLRLVARDAWLDVERRGPVCAVTVAACLIRMRTDRGRVQSLRLVVAPHAARRTDRLIDSEAVTVLAHRQRHDADRIRWMQRRLHRSVATRADLCGRAREPLLPVTVAARNVGRADVHGVSRTRAHLLPGHRHRCRRRTIAPAACADHHGDRDQEPRHRAPIG